MKTSSGSPFSGRTGGKNFSIMVDQFFQWWEQIRVGGLWAFFSFARLLGSRHHDWCGSASLDDLIDDRCSLQKFLRTSQKLSICVMFTLYIFLLWIIKGWKGTFWFQSASCPQTPNNHWTRVAGKGDTVLFQGSAPWDGAPYVEGMRYVMVQEGKDASPSFYGLPCCMNK